MGDRLSAVYRIRGPKDSIEARAQGIAVEQSVEMPLAGIDDQHVLDDIVGKVEAIEQLDDELFDARIGLAVATVGGEAGQLLNMLFGNTSIHEDVTLHDFDLPDEMAAGFGGPHHGLDELRGRVGAGRRAMTCSALKPQGVAPGALAVLAEHCALGRVDYIKDDHGLADQAYAPYEARVGAIAAAVRKAVETTGHATRYLPSLTGDLDALRAKVEFGLEEGLDTFLVQPMIAGPANMHALVRRYPEAAFFAHPTMTGAARIAPPALFGKFFRLLGADGSIYTNHGGRFGYTPETCKTLAANALAPWHGFKPTVPIPAGGMTLQRVPEMLDFYGPDVMLLIGGDLLLAREKLAEACAAFTDAVAGHEYGAAA